MKRLVVLFLLLSPFSGFADDVPESLAKLGFKRSSLISYSKTTKGEVFTFFDSRTENPDDIVIFTVKEGQIEEEEAAEFIAREYKDQYKKVFNELGDSLDKFKKKLLEDEPAMSYSDILEK